MELVTVFQALNPAEAEIISTQLDAAGFDVTIADEYSTLTLPAAVSSGVRVQVPSDQSADARALLESTVNSSSGTVEPGS